MTFDELKTLLQEMTRAEANTLADKADVPKSTVAKIRKGHTMQPRINTVEALSRALELKSRKTSAKRKAGETTNSEKAAR